ncbi:hypothetical protein ACFLQ2_02685 [archaeon]
MKTAFLLILFLGLCSAQLVVTQSAPATATTGEAITVDIVVENVGNEIVDVVLEQMVGYTPLEPEPQDLGIEGFVTPLYYQWEFTLAPGDNSKVFFRERLDHAYNSYVVGSAVAYVGGETYESNSIRIEISCNANGVCEFEEGEQAINCPQDCAGGSEDFLCLPVEDGVCDPDCAKTTEGWDPDCTEEDSGENSTSGDKTNYVLVALVLAIGLGALLAVKKGIIPNLLERR